MYTLLWSVLNCHNSCFCQMWITGANQTFHQFHDLDTELDLHRLWVVSMEHLQRVWHASRERLPFRTPGSVPILGLANAPIVETKFLELAMSLLDFSPRIPLGTFSILLTCIFLHAHLNLCRVSFISMQLCRKCWAVNSKMCKFFSIKFHASANISSFSRSCRHCCNICVKSHSNPVKMYEALKIYAYLKCRGPFNL